MPAPSDNQTVCVCQWPAFTCEPYFSARQHARRKMVRYCVCLSATPCFYSAVYNTARDSYTSPSNSA